MATAVVKTRPKANRTFGRGDLATSMFVIFPLFVIYNVGLAFSPTVNGVDFVSRWMFQLVKGNRLHYLILQAGFACAFLLLVLYLRRKHGLRIRSFLPMFLESALYALTLGSAIIFVMDKLFAPVLGLAIAYPILDISNLSNNFIMAIGAGVHEETIFRLGLMTGLAWVLNRSGMGPRWSWILATICSALLFSAAHHIGPLGEPFSRAAFTYRTLAGIIFGCIYFFRSLGHAVYTHALYDIYVMVLRPQ